MKFTVDKHEKYVLIQLKESRLDRNISPKLKTELILINAEGQRNIILDVSSIKETDESDLSSLLVGHRLCEASDGRFIVTGVSDDLSHLMSLSQLDKVLITTSRKEEAVDLIFIEEIERELNQKATH